LNALRKMVPISASPAHWRWTISCMAAASSNGAAGSLHRSELRSIVRCANKTAVSTKQLDEALHNIEDAERQRGLPHWLHGFREGDGANKMLSVRTIAMLLQQLSTATPEIAKLFNEYANEDGHMGAAEWLEFVRKEQLHRCGDAPERPPAFPCQGADLNASGELAKRSEDESEWAQAMERFESASSFELQRSQMLTRLQFAMQLLAPPNDAVAPAWAPGTQDKLSEPFPSYWTATTHNSYLLGDQFTGISHADVYRRQLLQGVRQVEIDCWDGSAGPIVTHGHTFCTKETFEAVIKAIAECAFVTSKLPVVLSLEMHCTAKQQHKIGKLLIAHLGSYLLPYEELLETGRAAELSPLDLQGRVMVKGKVKQPSRRADEVGKRPSFLSRSSRGSLGTADAPGNRSMSLRLPSGRRLSLVRSPSKDRSSSFLAVDSDGTFETDESLRRSQNQLRAAVDSMARARRKLYGRSAGIDSDSGARQATDPLYTSCLSIRSSPISHFLDDDKPQWPVPISSVNELRMLSLLGLTPAEQNQIAGHDQTEYGAQLTLVRLAANPSPEIGILQKKTSKWLLRPFPIGLRTSGKNMSPLPCWLSGAQSVALNFSPIDGRVDLAVQLHWALFNGSDGYVLKPREMRGALSPEVDDGTVLLPHRTPELFDWPPTRDKLHRATIEVLSLHNLPKRSERRPRYDGRHAASHKYLCSELSGTHAPPDRRDASSPALVISLHPIGGFCAVTKQLPIPHNIATEAAIPATTKGNGMNAAFATQIHCVAAEPHAVFLRVGVFDGAKEVAFETAVLGRLRGGYRVFQMRNVLGTRIELCYLFAKITFGSELNLQTTRKSVNELRQRISRLEFVNQMQANRPPTFPLPERSAQN